MFAVLAFALVGTTEIDSSGAIDPPPLVRSVRGGRWSDPTTWERGVVPPPFSRVQVRAGHLVLFDIQTEAPIRSIHVAGTLRFDVERSTRLDVGLIKIEPGDNPIESGFACAVHPPAVPPGAPRPALEVGTMDRPVPADQTATIRLTPVTGLDPEECPAIVCCGGRWDVHGSPMERTWVKLGSPIARGATRVLLAQPVPGWRPGDRIIVTATQRMKVPDDAEAPSVRGRSQTEERIIVSVEGQELILDTPLDHAHFAYQDYRGEVANLTRNVVIESADPHGIRGHTMYHRGSAGSISYAEFRHLGKPGRLGKYSLHFHLVRDTMRGSSVVGASIWDSANRWITIHGTDYLVVRDCVGYGSVGHGFFLEDGTEVFNILERNLAVQAWGGRPLPGQVLGYDRNEGAGFWWANNQNAFLDNVAVECDEYGFRYDAPDDPGFDPVLSVPGWDGVARPVDIRTLPLLRFEGNEAHTQRRYGLNLGGKAGSGEFEGVGGVGPASSSPSLIRDCRIWETHWGITPATPGLLIDGLSIAESDFGFWKARHDRHAYRRLVFFRTRWPAGPAVGDFPEERSYPAPLSPRDHRPPVTVITRVTPEGNNRWRIQGVSVDDTEIHSVVVNGREARPLAPGFRHWEAQLDHADSGSIVSAVATDEAGNREPVPHQITIPLDPLPDPPS
jgi:hypothetical protein